MNIKKLNLIAISAATLLSFEVVHAGSFLSGSAAPIAKRSVLLSVGEVKSLTGDISNNLARDGYDNASTSSTGDAKTIAVGYRMPIGHRYSVDMTYIDQGDIAASIKATPVGGNTKEQTAKEIAKSLPINGSGLNYAGLMHFPVANRVTAQAGAGGFLWTNEREATVGSVTHVEKDSGISAMVQLGLNISVTHGVSVEMTAQHFFLPGHDADRLSLGVSVNF